jgi:transcriptional regulator with XRE-family HTH domain
MTMPRNPKTRALGSTLRQAREDRGLRLREFATILDQDSGALSRWETGDRTPKPEQVAQILTALGVNGHRYAEIMTLAYRTDESQWLATTLPEQRQQMAAYIEWEQTATRIVEVSPLLIPGLLQTSDYVQALMVAEGVPTGEIAPRVTTRLGRSKVITKTNPAELVVLIGEGALRQGIGGPAVMLGQLRHLLTMAARPNITMRVFPNDRSYHPGLDGVFTIIEVGRAASGAIVFVDARRSPLMLHQTDDVQAYKRAVDRVAGECLPPQASARLVMHVAHEWEEKVDAGKHLAQVQPQPQQPDLRRGVQHA